MGFSRFPTPFDAHGIRIRFSSSLIASADAHQGGSIQSLGPEWVAAAELVILRVAREGSVVRTLHIPKVRLDRRR
jgi:hypothetical protein